MRRAIGTICLCALVCFRVALRGQAPDGSVRSEWLHDGTLVVTELNFAISAPSGFKWRQDGFQGAVDGKTSMFSAIAPDGNSEFSVVFTGVRTGVISQQDAELFAHGMLGTIPKGWTVGDTYLYPGELRVAGSARIRTSINAPEGEVYYLHAYIIPARWAYIIAVRSAQGTEPSAFAEFASSFRLLGPASNQPPGSAITGLVFLSAIIGAVVDWRYKRKGGVKPTASNVRYLAIGSGVGGLLILWAGLEGMSAYDLGELTSFVCMWLFAVWELGRFIVRRKNPLPRLMRT